jgi:hypothetical protein
VGAGSREDEGSLRMARATDVVGGECLASVMKKKKSK